MKQNLMILCYDYELSKSVANILSDYFSMRVLDETEMFDFDFSPRTLNEILELYGEEFVLKKFRKIASSHYDYEGIIFISHLKIINLCREKFEIFNEKTFTIFLEIDKDKKYEIYKTNSASLFFKDTKNFELEEEFLKNNLADVSIDAYNKSVEEISSIVINSIKKYYNII